MRVFDAHTHVYSQEAALDPCLWAAKRREAHWARLVRASAGRPSLQGFVSQKEMLQAMDEAGVEKALLLGWYWENPSTCTEHNTFMTHWVKACPERFVASMALHPHIPGGIDALKAGKAAGFKALGEVFPVVQGFELEDPQWRSMLEWASEEGMPITFHVTEPVGREHPGAIRSPLEDYVKLAQEYPDLKMILAHWGGLLPFYELNPFIKKALRNVYYDTAATSLLYDERIWRSVVDIVGADKVLFGSDYPLRLNPKELRPQIKPLVEEAGKELSLEAQKAVFWNNALRIFNL